MFKIYLLKAVVISKSIGTVRETASLLLGLSGRVAEFPEGGGIPCCVEELLTRTVNSQSV